MSEIPEDIKKAALAVIGTRSQSMNRGVFDGLHATILSQAVDAIAAALMAEREQCAQIAESNNAWPSEGADIADAIRRGTPHA